MIEVTFGYTLKTDWAASSDAASHSWPSEHEQGRWFSVGDVLRWSTSAPPYCACTSHWERWKDKEPSILERWWHQEISAEWAQKTWKKPQQQLKSRIMLTKVWLIWFISSRPNNKMYFWPLFTEGSYFHYKGRYIATENIFVIRFTVFLALFTLRGIVLIKPLLWFTVSFQNRDNHSFHDNEKFK